MASVGRGCTISRQLPWGAAVRMKRCRPVGSRRVREGNQRGWPFARTCVLEDDATMYASQRCSLNAVVRSVKHRAAGCSFAAVASALCEGSMTAPTVTPARCCTVLQCSCPNPPKPTTPIESSAARNAARAVLISTTHRVLRKGLQIPVQ
jgi:hypothetical protein